MYIHVVYTLHNNWTINCKTITQPEQQNISFFDYTHKCLLTFKIGVKKCYVLWEKTLQFLHLVLDKNLLIFLWMFVIPRYSTSKPFKYWFRRDFQYLINICRIYSKCEKSVMQKIWSYIFTSNCSWINWHHWVSSSKFWE